MTLPLFSPDDLPDPPSPAQAAQSIGAGKPRLRVPIRDQIVVRWESLDESIGCEARRRSGSTRNVATVAYRTCPYAANRVVASSHC